MRRDYYFSVKRNVGILDRILRVGLGLVLVPVGLILLAVFQGKVPGLVIAGLGGIGLVTGITGFCPLYVPFGINTLEKEKELIDRFKSRAAEHMDRRMSMAPGHMDSCMSMMVSFRQGFAASGGPPSVMETHNPPE
ncbi:MAG TPA: DUF2892 domain-containing protein [Anaerolineales bacterium]|nr:DUF2892 domain-containing protein [Anaerolineales bacterium]